MYFLYIRIANSTLDLPWVLSELGEQVKIYEETDFDPVYPPAPEEFEKLDAFLSGHSYDCLISYLFVPEISDICQKRGIPYIGWVFDSPLTTLFQPAAKNPCNYLFIFDRAEYEYLKSLEIPHLYYQPLGVNLSRTGALELTSEDEESYSCDISFVGNLYEYNSYNRFIHLFPADIAAELKLYLLEHLCTWHHPKPWPRLSQRTTDYMNQTFGDEVLNHGHMDLDLFLGITFLSKKLAQMDRITVLNTLAEHFKVDLYTRGTPSYLANVQIHPSVNYYSTMNKVFYLSRINLNITQPSIETGLPQRILDIMGSGGFCLSNYQPELEDYFVIGRDIEVFRDLEELKDKTAYYLSHEKERLTIAMNGYQRICEKFSYTRQLRQILQTVKEDLT